MPKLPITEAEYDKWDLPIQKEDRSSAPKRGYGRKWYTARARYLAVNPFCVKCREKGKLNYKKLHVDHIIPHRGDMELFWDKNNWQTLCEFHHNQKTGRGE